ncbi:MAG: sigma 54-interacting transcriptional regulator [Syntrophomonadaceae bacterium]|nr:sigma 54-interacting transcriptional regulator [Syntrophomonadaceae bacterium]
MKAYEAMNEPLFFNENDSMCHAAGIMVKRGTRVALLIDEQSTIIGVITKDMLLEAIGQGVSPETDLGTLNWLPLEMIDYNMEVNLPEETRAVLAVMKDGRVVGIIDGEVSSKYARQARRIKTELEAAIDAVVTPIIVINKKKQVTLISKQAGKVLGIDARQAEGRPLNEVISDETIIDLLSRPELLSGGKIRVGTHSFVPFSKNVINNQEVIGRVLVLRDVSELEQVLQESEFMKDINKELEAIIDSSFDGLYVTDGEANTLRVSKGFERIMGVSKEQCVGRNMAELVKEGVFSRSGTLLAIEKGGRVTIDLVASTGKEALVTSTPIFDENGKIIRVVTNVRDMTELNQLQRKLDLVQGLREREMEAVIESSFDGLYVTDGKANTLRLNQGFERIMGVSAAECVGRNMEELVEHGIFSRSGTLLALEKKEPVTITLTSKTGKEALVTSNPIFDEEGKVVMVVTNVRDITELNDLQRRLEHMEGLREWYETELQQLKMASSHQLVINSAKMKEVVKLVLRVAQVDSTVLIQGESGVGKEVIAGIIHSNSNRKDGPFIKVNCGAIPDNLLESELFGYEAGAFTGANRKGKVGYFELAEGGVLFLDEIAELPLNLQVKLLRVLQDHEIVRVGGVEPIKVDIRVLTGTNRNLTEMVDKKEFRLDLFYRLNVIPIFVPPLRERQEDIPILAKLFINNINNKYQMEKHLDQRVIERFMDYSWPGNVRELENLVERLAITSINNVITIGDLPINMITGSFAEKEPARILPLKAALEKTERNLLETAYHQYKSTYQVARALEVNQSTIVRKAAKYGLKFEH